MALIAGILLVCRPLKGNERGLMRSFVPTAGSVERQWHVIDAEGQVLGRIATEAARLLQGKHKAVYTPYIDTGDHVVIVNAAKVRLTGRKEEQKLYRYHSGYEGGVREERVKEVRAKQPTRIVEEAVRGMLPKTKMGEAMWRKLKVYAGADHPHASQKPKKLKSEVAHLVAATAIQYYGTGRRKTSTARVFLRPGNGILTINHKPLEQAFPTEALRTQTKRPLAVTKPADKFDVLATIAGGGIAGQAGALRLGIARALVEYNLELRPQLKKEGFLTRDARIKERKKYGQKGARKRFQFSKR